MTTKTNLKCKSGEIISGQIIQDLVLRHALILANCKDDVRIEHVLSQLVGPLPISLFL